MWLNLRLNSINITNKVYHYNLYYYKLHFYCYKIIYLLCVSILKNNGIIGVEINLTNLRKYEAINCLDERKKRNYADK